LLPAAAQTVAVHLELEDARAERDELAALALVGEAMSSLAHDLNNHLNSMVLQAAALQIRAGEPLREDLAVIRREGIRAASLMRPLQRFRESCRRRAVLHDLNAAVHAAVADFPSSAGRIEMVLADDLPPLTVPSSELKRLLALVLKLAAGWHTMPHRPLRLRTGADDDSDCLILETRGTPFDAPATDLFDGEVSLPPVLDDLEEMALRSLVRQTGAHLQVAGCPQGVDVVLSWELPSETEA
jgi:hypothetical protein